MSKRAQAATAARNLKPDAEPTTEPDPNRHPPGTTPVMAQFLDMKAAHPDCLLFFRMGDFYELFFEDAPLAAEALGIALTKRGKHGGEEIPMCGVPIHHAERYLHELIRKGFRVAVAEQVEDPAEARKRGYKAVVRREVVRLVTPGTLTEDTLLEQNRHNFLAAFAEIRGAGALAWCDISTGDLRVASCPRAGLSATLARLSPAELLLKTPMDEGLIALSEEMGATPSELSPASFDPRRAEERVAALFGANTLDAYGAFSPPELSALGALVDYLELTQRGQLPLLKPPAQERAGATMRIDPATRANLELARSLSGARDGSLLSVIDRTATGAGARLLEARLASPLTELPRIADRQDQIEFFLDRPDRRSATRDSLRRTPDIDRALSRLGLLRGGPRDLASLRDGLSAGASIRTELQAADRAAALTPEPITALADALAGHDALIEEFDRALVEEPPLRLSDGGAIAPGYDAELDETRALRDQSRQVIADLQTQYQSEAGINSLKVKHNNVLGYFVETPATHAQKMMSSPLDELFIHRQTTANAVRFTTVELSELEGKISRAGDRAAELERAAFDRLAHMALERAGPISETAAALAALDVASSLAELAEEENWVRPVVEDTRRFEIAQGRHPVVERALRRANEPAFVANDCDLSADVESADPIWLITGPNMAGKSTFLRQNALIAVLAQMGSYVPAQAARIGVVDALFSRVGASDDLARGRSTFMVEMVEAAAILNQAGERALVILDEIGRGTATYDGLSIAWATLEHLQEVNGCRALFATHYHELTALAAKLPGLRNATVAVREWKGDIVFLREIVAGAADRSYGVQVARLAGLPKSVVARAKDILKTLESGEDSAMTRAQRLVDDLPLFAANPGPTEPETSQVEEQLRALDPDAMTPRDALDALYALKGLLEE